MMPTATAMMTITMTATAAMMPLVVAFAMMFVPATAAMFMSTAFFIAMIVPATTTTTAAFATDMVQHLLHIYVRSLAIFNNFALKQQVQSCERVVQVPLHARHKPLRIRCSA